MNEDLPQPPQPHPHDNPLVVEGASTEPNWLQRLARAMKALGRSIVGLATRRQEKRDADREHTNDKTTAVSVPLEEEPLEEQIVGGTNGQHLATHPPSDSPGVGARMFENANRPRFGPGNQFKAAGRDINECNLTLRPGVIWTITGSVVTAKPPVVPSPGAHSSQTSGRLIPIVRRPSSLQVVEYEGRLTVSAINDFDIPTIAPNTLSNAEVYARQLSPSRGLACWKPEPFHPFVGESGVVPGDVGTYTAEDGFKKTFNIWEDALSIGQSASVLNERDYERPPHDIIHCPRKMQVGEIVAEGVSRKLSMSTINGTRRISSCDFRCLKEQGAVLALTSPADLHEVADPVALHGWLLKHVRLLCRFANRRRHIGLDDSLYIITGCIKGDHWALAAFKEPAETPNHTLRLVRDNNEEDSLYFWAESPRSADARSSDGPHVGLKNQSLFLRGFRVTLSPEFHAKLNDTGTTNLSPPGASDDAEAGGAGSSGPYPEASAESPSPKSTRNPDSSGYQRSTNRDYQGRALDAGTHSLGVASVSQPPEFHILSDGGDIPDLRSPHDNPGNSGPHSSGPDGLHGHDKPQKPRNSVQQGSTSDGHHDQGVNAARHGSIDAFKIDIFPEDRAQVYHPCETINKCILGLASAISTKADIAISHDDEWIHRMESSGWDEALQNMVQDIKSQLIKVRIRHGVGILNPGQRRTAIACGHHLGTAFLCSVFIGCSTPAQWNLNSRFHVEAFSFCIPTDLRPLPGGEPLSRLAQVWESETSALKDLLERPPSIRHVDGAGLTIISYGPHSPISNESHDVIARFSSWKSIFQGPSYPEVILACCLWHVARAFNHMLEYVDQSIPESATRVIWGNAEPRWCHFGGGDSDTAKLLLLAVSHLHQLEDAVENTRLALEESPFIRSECSSLLGEIARVKGVTCSLQTSMSTRATRSACEGDSRKGRVSVETRRTKLTTVEGSTKQGQTEVTVRWEEDVARKESQEMVAANKERDPPRSWWKKVLGKRGRTTTKREDQERMERELAELEHMQQEVRCPGKQEDLDREVQERREGERPEREREAQEEGVEGEGIAQAKRERIQQEARPWVEREKIDNAAARARVEAAMRGTNEHAGGKHKGSQPKFTYGPSNINPGPHGAPRSFKDVTSDVENIVGQLTRTNSHDAQSISESDLHSLLLELCSTVDLRRQLLHLKGEKAQWWLDVLQLVLDSDASDIEGGRDVLVPALLRLSRESALYPNCLQFSHQVQMSTQPVAAGSFGEVYRGSVANRVVAVKVFRIYERTNLPKFMKTIRREAVLWSQLYHANVLPCYGMHYLPTMRPHQIGLISPWMEGGNVRDYLLRNPHSERLLLLSDIASGLWYLHKRSIVHGDLKGANILVSTSGRACLADFGLSKFSENPSFSTVPARTSRVDAEARGTLRWQAPELLDLEDENEPKTTTMSDVYSYGCVCYEITTAKTPFYQIMNHLAIPLLTFTGQRPRKPDPTDPAYQEYGLTEPIWSFIETCWNQDPALRPTAQELQESPLFTSLSDDRPAQEWGEISAAEFRRSIMPVSTSGS